MWVWVYRVPFAEHCAPPSSLVRVCSQAINRVMAAAVRPALGQCLLVGQRQLGHCLRAQATSSRWEALTDCARPHARRLQVSVLQFVVLGTALRVVGIRAGVAWCAVTPASFTATSLYPNSLSHRA